MNDLLFGHNADEGIVALHQSDESGVRVYRRRVGILSSESVELYPFFYMSSDEYLSDFRTTSGKRHWIARLSGDNYYKFLAAFSKWSDMWDAVHHFVERYNRTNQKNIRDYTETDAILLRPDPIFQYLVQSGRTLFKGMEFNEIRRLQIGIETHARLGSRRSNPEKPEDRILLIALSDNCGLECVIGEKGEAESTILRETVKVIRERDPDVVEGHNLLNFVLPYLLKRCEINEVELAISRDGSEVHRHGSRTPYAERGFEFAGYDIAGRHAIDTSLLFQSHDLSRGNIEGYSLRAAAQHFGLASPGRTYLEKEKIAWYWEHDRAAIVNSAVNDVREIRKLSEQLSGGIFYLTQMLPLSYDTVARTGSAAKVESLLLREYFRRKHSVPRPDEGRHIPGGYADVFLTGPVGPIVQVDVESLYPSIMVTQGISPRKDVLQIFGSLLEELTARRLEKKRQMRNASPTDKQAGFGAIQSSLKTLVNSFYGYLGYSRGLFNDYECAEEVTRAGQRILRQMIKNIQSEGGTVIEVDTDGIHFVPPANVTGEDAEREMVRRLSEKMPEGIRISFEGRFKLMLSYKTKNYALLGYDDRIEVKGSSLISRGMERFARNYIRDCIECLLYEKIDKLHELYVSLYKDIRDHKLDIRDFAKTETLRDTIEEYERDVVNGKRNRTASYELAKLSGRKFKVGDRVSYYFTGLDANITGFENCKLAEGWDANFPDENAKYYLRRLEECSSKFKTFFTPQDLHRIFSLDDLFGFTAEGIHPVTAEVKEYHEGYDGADEST
jgi:DNA polymerase elongation subunit (family B)